MARIATIGFEGTTQLVPGMTWREAAGNAASISSTTKRSGNYAGRINAPVSGEQSMWGYLYGNGNSNTPRFIRFYLRVDAAPNAETAIFTALSNNPSILSTTGNVVWLTLDAARQLRLYDEDSVIGSPSSALALNTWYRIEVQHDRSGVAGAHVVRARVDGTEFAGSSTRDLSSGTRAWKIGVNLIGGSASAGEWFFDDIAMNDNAGTVQNSYPGEGKIIYLSPNGTDTDAGWTSTHATDWQAVSETTPDDATSYVSSNTTGHTTEFTVDDAAPAIGNSDKVSLLDIWVRFRGQASTDTNATFATTLRAVTGGTRETGSSINVNGSTWNTNQRLGNNYSTSHVAYLLPGTSRPWTKADVDAVILGLQLVSADTSGVDVSTVLAAVEYVPAATPLNLITPVGSVTTAGNFSSTASGTPPTGTNGDLLIAQVGVDGSTITGAPAGWTLFASEVSGSAKVYAYYRVATGTDGFSAGLSGGTSWGIAFRRYAGVDTNAPLDVAASTGFNSGTGQVVVPGITTVTAGAMLIGGAITNDGSSTFAHPTLPLLEIFDNVLGRSAQLNEGELTVAGATGNMTFVASNGFAQTSGWIVALRPASVGGGDATPSASDADTLAGTDIASNLVTAAVDDVETLVGVDTVFELLTPSDQILIAGEPTANGSLFSWTDDKYNPSDTITAYFIESSPVGANTWTEIGGPYNPPQDSVEITGIDSVETDFRLRIERTA